MKSIMPAQQHFATTPQVGNIQRSTFDRSKGHKTTFDAGGLIPFYVDEILPGDTLKLKTSIFARLATPIKPIMDNLHLETFYFFVPNRIIWDNWEAFNGQTTQPIDINDPINYVIPTVNLSQEILTHSLFDYMGIPPLGGAPTNPLAANALPFRAYNQIINDWFRDQNIQTNVPTNVGDGPDTATNYNVIFRGKRHDYFTSCLPWPQKGAPVTIGLSGDIPVIGNGLSLGLHDGGFNNEAALIEHTVGNGLWTSQADFADGAGAPASASPTTLTTSTAIGVVQDGSTSGLIGQLSGATAITINDLREAVAIQQVLEMDARGGTRYVEFLKNHFGVTSPDFRLQRAEFLGSSSDMININPVTQTSETVEGGIDSPQGNLAATGTVSSQGGFIKSFTEHGYVIGLVNVRADLTYQQGLERHWRRSTKYDFYLPSFAHLGEQAVLQEEIFYQGLDFDEVPVFGYQERFAEYRYNPSLISGLFRSQVSSGNATLDIWHLSEIFETNVELVGIFIEDRPPIDRVIALEDEPHLIFDSYLKIAHTRAMPMYSVPGLRRL